MITPNTAINIPSKVFLASFAALLLLAATQWIHIRLTKKQSHDGQTPKVMRIGRRYVALRVVLVVIMVAMAAVGMKLE